MADTGRQSRCLIVATHYMPLVGGAQTVYDALARTEPARISILTAIYDYVRDEPVEGTPQFDDSVPYRISRIPRMRAPLLGANPGIFAKLINAFRESLIRWEVASSVLKAHDRERFETICVGSLDALGWLVSYLKAKTRAKIIVYAHGEEISQKAYSTKAERNRANALQAADGVVAVSNYTGKLIQERYGLDEKKIAVITNGVDLERFQSLPRENVRPCLGLPLGPLVLAVGRLVPRKGFDKLLEAWPRVLAAVPNATLAIAGGGPLADTLQTRALSEEMKASVHMLGHVSAEILPSLYASADIFAMPNRTMPDGDTEGFGLVFLEAAATGTPGVGGKAGGAVDAILDGETGLHVDGNDIGSIAFAITELLTNEVKRKAMGEAAKTYAATQGWERKAAEFLTFLDRQEH